MTKEEKYSQKYIGKKYNRLTIISYIYRKEFFTVKKSGLKKKQYMYFYRCKCDCGKEKIVSLNGLLNGHIKSCGCLHKEKVIKHNKSNSKLYYIWKNIKGRCICKNNKSYKNYGGRGVNICKNWMDSFIEFYNWAINNGYKEGLTIDRIDNNGNYCPENCRWVSFKEQANNRRNNICKEYKGKYKTLSEWASFLGVKYKTFWIYVKNNGFEKALKYYWEEQNENNVL